MTERVDVAVVGGGPAGLSAAVEVARVGLTVVVLDENRSTGGQIFRQPPGEFRRAPGLKPTRQWMEGQALIEAVADSKVRVVTGATVWGSFSPGSIEVVVDGQNRAYEFRALVVAAGAHDRPIPIPGWTLPGVMSAGGTQALLKSHGVLPGRRILVAGSGPLQLVVASQLVEMGANVVAVVEAVPMAIHLKRPLDLLRGGRSLLDGVRYRWSVFRAGVPWISPAIVRRVDGDGRAEVASVTKADRDWRAVAGTERTFEVDAVCLGYGLVPSVDLLRHLGCELRYDEIGAAWIPERDENGETSLSNVFAVGDGARIAGVKVAIEEGCLAGITIAGRLSDRSNQRSSARQSRMRRRLKRLNRFAGAMNRAYAFRSGMFDLAEPQTTICRCEEVTAADLSAAIAAGAGELVQLKARTGLGMGPCQGKMCGGAAAHLLASESRRKVLEFGSLSSRAPIRPIPLSSLMNPAPDSDPEHAN